MSQNGSVTEAMTPIAPGDLSANRNRVAGSTPPVSSATSGWTRSMASRISADGTTLARSHFCSASRGMYSMNRTSYPDRRENRAKSTTSSSFVPAITTQFSLIGVRPAVSAARSPVITWSSASRRVISANRCRIRESHDTVTRSNPARASGSASLSRR